MTHFSGTTIVIPAFNRPLQLEEAIKSVLGQTEKSFDLVVVDDASPTDLSACRKLVESTGHTWLALPENRGPAHARNAGIAAAPSNTEWIAFLDSDDIWFPDKLELQLAWHHQHPDYRISQVIEDWYRNGDLIKKPAKLRQKGGDIFADSLTRCTIGPSCVIFRRDLWEDTGGFNPWYRVCEDFELWLRITDREKIGLVEGKSLVRKNGGHSDQLSTQTPALDRFRFVALAEYDGPKNDEIEPAFFHFAKILASGSRKRGHDDWADFFESLSFPLADSEIEKAKRFCEIDLPQPVPKSGT